MIKNKWLLVSLILAVAALFRLQHISTVPIASIDGAMNGIAESAESLKIVSAITGIVAVLGLYLLASRLFNWQIGALSSYLLAISFWHVNFSRAGASEISASLFFTFSVYFLWLGISSAKFRHFTVGGIFLGLTLYVYEAPYAALAIPIVAVLAYWQSIKKDFSHEKYLHTRNKLIRGLALMFITAFIAALPVVVYFYSHPGDFWGGSGRFSVFASSQPLKELAVNTGRTLAMFNFKGDTNWTHNISGQPLLLWPIGALFVVGIIKSLIKFFAAKKKHGHFSSIQSLLLSWFIIGLVPAFLSVYGSPDSLSAVFVAPVVFIFAAEGLWWIVDKLGDWYHARDMHEYSIRRRWLKESSVAAIFALVILLLSFSVAEYDKYFNKWAENPNVTAAFEKMIPSEK